MPKVEPWRSRIIGHGTEDPTQLLANPKNWRIHPKPQQDALAGVLDEVGWVQDIIVNQRTQHVVDGHLRVSLAISRREASVPVVYVDLDEAEEAKILATIDPVAAMAVADKEQLDRLLHEVDSGSAAIQAMLSDLAAKAGLIPPTDPNAEWQGMPEFEQEDLMGVRRLIVHFQNEKDVVDFERLVGQNLTKETKYIWYPEQKRQQRGDFVSDES